MTDQLLGVRSQLTWGHARLSLSFSWDVDAPVALVGVTVDGVTHALHSIGAVQVVTANQGHHPASDRLVHTSLGARLRYVSHTETVTPQGRSLVITQHAEGIRADWTLELHDGIAVVHSSVLVSNTGSRPEVLRSVASWSAGFTAPAVDDVIARWQRISGTGDWLGEGRWSRGALRDDLPVLEQQLTGHNPRSAYIVTSDGTWSTGKHQPVGALVSADAGLAWAWQIEHNGAWRAEIGEDSEGGYLALSGPTEIDSSWVRELAPGDAFETVPVQIAVARDFESVVAQLTAYRRSARRVRTDNTAMSVVFNDYMNTLNGDPTTEKLLPLVAAAAEVGAEIFCIDAGWYDDSGFWWDSVGEWVPSTTRFPKGLAEVIDAIRASGMVPGLWLEPEVIGVRSPLAVTLPDEAFLLRRGQRIVEHDRYHLDLRHPAARAHLDEAVDRLVRQFGIGFFKFDYNINPGAGTDHDAHSVGDGLLQHNRAHLAWLDGLLDRHPDLVIENCSSGAMRADFAILSRLDMQSTSDQQDFTRFPPIAASAALTMLPEQAANWAYPQPEMDAETAAFCLVTGLLGRFYLSGYLNQMSDASRALVAEAVHAAKAIRRELPNLTPSWPLGLPGWNDEWISFGLRGETSELVSLWRRGGDAIVELSFPHFAGSDLRVDTVFPATLPAWNTSWDRSAGILTVHATDAPVAARTLRLTPVSS